MKFLCTKCRKICERTGFKLYIHLRGQCCILSTFKFDFLKYTSIKSFYFLHTFSGKFHPFLPIIGNKLVCPSLNLNLNAFSVFWWSKKSVQLSNTRKKKYAWCIVGVSGMHSESMCTTWRRCATKHSYRC